MAEAEGLGRLTKRVPNDMLRWNNVFHWWAH